MESSETHGRSNNGSACGIASMGTPTWLALSICAWLHICLMNRDVWVFCLISCVSPTGCLHSATSACKPCHHWSALARLNYLWSGPKPGSGWPSACHVRSELQHRACALARDPTSMAVYWQPIDIPSSGALRFVQTWHTGKLVFMIILLTLRCTFLEHQDMAKVV